VQLNGASFSISRHASRFARNARRSPTRFWEIMMTFRSGLWLCSLLLGAMAAVSISAAQPGCAPHQPDLKALHANVAALMEKTDIGMAGQS
jgi:hypothetical protein